MLFKEWAELTSCNGIIDLYNSKGHKCRFTFWILTMLLMLSCWTYFTIITIFGFVNTPTVTSYTTKLFTEKRVPKVAMCFNGGMNGTALSEANFSYELILGLSERQIRMNESGKRSIENELKNYLNTSNLDVIQFVKKFGYSCPDMVTEKIQASDDQNFTNVGCQDVVHFPTRIYGNCLLFQNNGNQTFPGLYGGVQFQLKTPPDSVSEVLSARKIMTTRSFSYLIGVDDKFAFNLDKTVQVIMNAKTEIILNPIYYHRITSCDPTTYSDTNKCFHKCYSDNIFETTGCIPLDYYNVFDDNETYACNYFASEYRKDELSIHECQSKCKPPCDEWEFETSLSVSLLSPSYGQNNAIVSIGYNKMQYTSIEEVYAFTYDMVVANVGGQAGLWLGCSFVTVIQAIYYLCLAWSEKLQYRNKVFISKHCQVQDIR